MPASLEEVRHIVAILAQYVNTNPDAASAVVSVNEDLKACAQQINQIGHIHSAFDLLEYVRFTQTVGDPNRYEESSQRGSPALIELVALALTANHTIDSSYEATSSIDYPLPEAVQRVLDLGSKLVELAVVRSMLVGLEAGESRDTLSHIARNREMFVRSPTYEHIAERTLDLLFSTPQMEQLCRDTLGFTAREACDLFLAIDHRCNMAVQIFQDRLRQFSEDSETLIRISGSNSVLMDEPDGIPQAEIAALKEQFDRIWFPIHQESTFRSSDIAAATGLPVDAVDNFIEVFEYTPKVGDPGDFIEEVISGPSPLRTRPILRDDENRRAGLGFCSWRSW